MMVVKSVGFQPSLWTKISKWASSCRGTLKQDSDPSIAQNACPGKLIHSIISDCVCSLILVYQEVHKM